MATVRPGRRIERAGVNALRTLLEDYDHIVQEIDGGNDHGEDFHVLLTRNGRRTGHVVAIQVKSGKKYKRARGYAIPIDDHFDDWRQSRIPVLGVVFDPKTSGLYWINLTKELRKVSENPRWIQIPLDAALTPETIRGFAAEVEIYIDRSGMRFSAATQEEAFAGAARALSGLDPSTAPNPLYETLGALALQHEDRVRWAIKLMRQLTPLLILATIMMFEWPYQIRFTRAYSTTDPLWVINIYIFIFFMAATILFEIRARRIPHNTMRFFGLIVSNFLWLPLIDNGHSHQWWGETWIALGSIVPNFGYLALLINFIGFAKDRQKKLKMAELD